MPNVPSIFLPGSFAEYSQNCIRGNRRGRLINACVVGISKGNEEKNPFGFEPKIHSALSCKARKAKRHSEANTISTLNATRVLKEISVRPRVQQYQAFSARCSHRYFSNASRSCGGLKNDPSFRLFATLKPLAVVEYNEGKCGIDYSDQMVCYATTIRKVIKRYRKLGTQLLLAISAVNASTVCKIATSKDINIGIFRELLIAKLLGLSEDTKGPRLRRSRHTIAVI